MKAPKVKIQISEISWFRHWFDKQWVYVCERNGVWKS